MGQVGPNVKSQPISNVDVHRFSFSPVGFDPHPSQVDSESGTAPQFNWRIPQIAI